MHLLLGLCLLFFNVGSSTTGCTEVANVFIHKLPYPLLSFSSSIFSFTFLFLFFLSLWFYLPHNSALWSQWQIPSAFQSGAKNNHLFFYSHWLCYNAATLRGQTRGQSIISPLPIQAAVWLLSAKNRDKPHLPLSDLQSFHSFSISTFLLQRQKSS